MEEKAIDLHFPVAGLDNSGPFYEQSPRDVGGGVYGRTAADAQNVRGYEATTLRRRGGQRPGLTKYIPLPLVADWVVQLVDVIVHHG